MALSTARIHRVRGRPPLLAAGITSLIHSHSSSVRSLGYIFSFIYPFYTTCADFSDRLLEPPAPHVSSADHVANQLRGYLDTVRYRSDLAPPLATFGAHLDTVSRSYWPGLFHCYEVPGLPRTNNELESHFRDTSHRLLRTTGHKGLTQRTLQRQGAWELLPRPSTEAAFLEALPHTSPEELAQERQRFAEHRRRFALQSRSRRQTQAQCAQLRQRWSALPATGTA